MNKNNLFIYYLPITMLLSGIFLFLIAVLFQQSSPAATLLFSTDCSFCKETAVSACLLSAGSSAGSHGQNPYLHRRPTDSGFQPGFSTHRKQVFLSVLCIPDTDSLTVDHKLPPYCSKMIKQRF